MNKDEFRKAVDDVIEDCLRNDCVFGNYAHKVTDAVWPLLEAAEKERDELRAKIEAKESRIELLEHDLKSGDYETLYAQTVAELAQIRKDADKFDDGIDWVQRALQAEAEVECLRAKIECMERQEPIGKFIQHPSNGMWEQDGYGDNPDAKPLYALPGAQSAPENCPCCDEPMRVYSRCSNSDCEAVTVTPGQARYNKALAFARTVATRMEDQTAPSVPDGWKEGVEAAARLIAQKAELYATRFGHDDMGGLSFGAGAHAEVKMDHYTGLLELADEVRAMLAAAPKAEGK